MSTTQTALISGLVLGLAATQGFIAFLVTLAIGFVGLIIGQVIDRKSFNVTDIFGQWW